MSAFKLSNVKVVNVDCISLVCERFPIMHVKLSPASDGVETETIILLPTITSPQVSEISGFDFKNLKNHQYLFLKKMCDSFNTCCFLIIYMSKFDKFYLIEFKKIVEYIQLNKTHIIHIDQMTKYGYELEICYPGILNLVEILEKIKL